MPVRFYRLERRLRNGVVEAFGIRMGKDYGDRHIGMPFEKRLIIRLIQKTRLINKSHRDCRYQSIRHRGH